jgi:predicted MFS family arabinose efflux permease
LKNAAAPEAKSLRDLSPRQWKSGIAAWLGWLFDGLDMHLYTLVAAPFVATLLGLAATDTANHLVKEKSSWIQAAFLVGWALGGGFFGRIGDRLGRSRALSLTILTYALFTGLSFFAQTWWQLLICRFLAALGIGGEWAVGSTLLSETWPKKWRPWIAAVLQMGVNLGVMLACLTGVLLKGYEPRYVFLVGILPALLVFWIRRHVPEPEEWHAEKAKRKGVDPGISELFRGSVRRTTLLTICICATSLTGWWAFMFWHPQHLMNLPELQTWTLAAKRDLVAQTFAWVIGISIIGNFVAGALAKIMGYRKAISLMFTGFFVTFLLAFGIEHSYQTLATFWLPAVGFWSGVFGLFTMCLPPLFPTLLRTTGAGFCYNIGRIAAAAGTVYFGIITPGGNFRQTLLSVGFLFLIALVVALWLPEPKDNATNQPLGQPVE